MPWKRDRLPTPVFLGFPAGSDGKQSVCNEGDLGLIPGSGKIPWRRAWRPTPVFFAGESHGQRSLLSINSSAVQTELSLRRGGCGQQNPNLAPGFLSSLPATTWSNPTPWMWPTPVLTSRIWGRQRWMKTADCKFMEETECWVGWNFFF